MINYFTDDQQPHTIIKIKLVVDVFVTIKTADPSGSGTKAKTIPLDVEIY